MTNQESRPIREIICEMEESEFLFPDQKKEFAFEMIRELENIRKMEYMDKQGKLSEKQQKVLEQKVSEFPSQDEIEWMHQMLLS